MVDGFARTGGGLSQGVDAFARTGGPITICLHPLSDSDTFAFMGIAKTKKPASAKPGKPAKTVKSTKKPVASTKETEAPAEIDLPDLVGSQRDYERFLATAQAIDARDVQPFRLDVVLAYHNVQRGVGALVQQEARIAGELPKVDLDHLRTLPEIALALSFAASQVDRGGGSSKNLAELLRKLRTLRAAMLSSAVALAVSGDVPKREVERIQEGRGSIDAAQDCVDLAALFRKHAAKVRGKTPITSAQITEAAQLGTDLLKILSPKSAKIDRSPKGDLKEAIAIRARFATLLQQRHELARRVGHWLWGADVDAHVPLLQARAVSKRSAAKGAKASGRAEATKGDKASKKPEATKGEEATKKAPSEGEPGPG